MPKPPTVKRLVFELGRGYRDRKRCEADVSETTARWRTQSGKDFRCELSALFKVDEHYFCKRHAGDHLLKELWLGDELVKRTTKPKRPTRTKVK